MRNYFFKIALRNQDKGFITTEVLAVRAPRVRDAAFGSRLLTFRVGSDQSKSYQIIGIDYDYLPLPEAKIVAGRNFDRSFSDSASLILNETATL